MEAKNSEVLKDTQATISCVVKGLTKQLDSVTWEKPGDVAITNGQDGYVIVAGIFDPSTKSQTTILTVPLAENTADKIYTCVITSNEHGVTTQKTNVNSNVFSKCALIFYESIMLEAKFNHDFSGFTVLASRLEVKRFSIISAIDPVNMDATDDIAQTLTCNIGDVTQAVQVSWKTSSNGDITDGVGGYTVTQGSVDVETNVQKSTLTITSAILKSLDTTSPLTWTCAAKSTKYTDSEQSAFQDVVVTFLTFGEF